MKAVVTCMVALIVAGIFASLPVHAQQSTTMTDEHVTRIKNACPTAIATLNQIHANDAPVYVNRNQAYFSISDKLIARLNSRLALNRYDTTALVKIASEYNTALTKFRTNYKLYDDAMAELIRVNCNKQPVGFYDKTADAKQLREAVHTSIAKLHTIIDQYRSAVETFEQQHESQLKGVTND